jgi:hypothetical protein
MSRDKNLWLRFGLAIGAGIQDNQLALPCEWDESLQSSSHVPTVSTRKTFRPQHAAKTPAFASKLHLESAAR